MSDSAVASQSVESQTPDALPTQFKDKRLDFERRLVELLKASFPNVEPNYARPLDGRVVEYRATNPGEPFRAVTDYELAAASRAKLTPKNSTIEERIDAGMRFKQVWSFTVDGQRFRFNVYWAGRSHHGYQCHTECTACGTPIWTNADQPPREQCRECRSKSGICMETGNACSTAYVKHGCRCDQCRHWNTERIQRHRDHHRTCNNFLSTTGGRGEEKKKNGFSNKGFRCTKKVVTRLPLADWTWIPTALRDHIARHVALVDEYFAKASAKSRDGGEAPPVMDSEYDRANREAIERATVRD